MVTLKKIAYCIGIGISLSIFVLFLYSALPNMIQNSNWDEFDAIPMNNEGMLETFKEHPAYAAFYERFPDAKEELSYATNSNHSELEVGIRNFETGVELVLSMNYNKYNDDVNVHINCNVGNPLELGINSSSLRANGLFVVDFIEYTECLELKTNLINTKSNPPKITYGPNDSTIVTIEPMR